MSRYLAVVQLVWFKRDLRVDDHEPLFRASQGSSCLGLFLYEPELIEADDFDEAHLRFINESLRELRQALRDRGGELVLRRGEAVAELSRLHAEYNFDRIWAHQETTNQVAYQRDRRVRAWAKRMGVAFRELRQHGVIRRLPQREGWSSRWQHQMNRRCIETPDTLRSPVINEPGAILEGSQFNVHRFTRSGMQEGGEREAHRCLQTFLEDRGRNYRKEMSSPVTAEQACSRISPHLAYGTLSLRRVHQLVRQRQQRIGDLPESDRKAWSDSLSSFQSRLSWHCHFMQKLEDEPQIEFQNINRAFDGLRENEFNRSYFDAWSHGRTGFPLVDACMRALIQTGWINFRMRALLVSFAAYQLWLHWREPALHLAKVFLDYEPGIHYSQLQMQSGVTGINTTRIYSPIKQVHDQDPQGEFIRRYVPELREVPDKHLAQPHHMTLMEQSFYDCRIGSDYPEPIVDHAKQYAQARERIHAHRRKPEVKLASRRVFEKHGSRKMSARQRGLDS